MNPIGTMPYFLAAVSSFLRARSRAASSSNLVWLKRASALRTCASSWIGKRRRPFESTYAKAALGSSARVLALSCDIRLPRPYPIPLGRTACHFRERGIPPYRRAPRVTLSGPRRFKDVDDGALAYAASRGL